MSAPHSQPGSQLPGTPGPDPILLQRYQQHLRDNQNLTLGVAGGAAGALLGAIGWALVAALLNLNVGFAAIGVGFLTGFGVRYLGKGIDKYFGVVGAVLAAVGVALGKMLSICIFIANEQAVPLTEVISNLDFDIVIEMIGSGFDGYDVLFYVLALWTGFKYSIRTITQEEVAAYGTIPNIR